MKNDTATTRHGREDSTFPPPITTEMLQFRLDTGNMLKNGGQRGSLTRCVQKYEAYQTKRRATETNADERETAKADLICELDLFELEMTKMILYEKGLERQVQQNGERIAKREQEIATLQQQVKESGVKACKFLDTQHCLSEYEALAKLINDKHPTSQEELQSKIGAIKEERTKVDREIEEAEKTLKVREAQFQLLIQYMLDLKRSLKEDEENDSVEKADGGNQTVAMEIDESLYGDL